MPVAIDPADRRLLLIAGSAFLLLLCAVAFLTPAGGQNEGTVPSSYSSGPGGTRAAFVLLQEMGFSVERWEASPVDLPPDLSHAVLILVDPEGDPNEGEKEALLHFVRTGGTILFSGPSAEEFFPEARLISQPFESRLKSFPAISPSIFTRGAGSVVFRPTALWDRIEGAQVPLYGNPQHPAAVSWRVGLGHILWWAGATPLTNARIAKDENLNLFLDAVEGGNSASRGSTKIYWDEYFHGERVSLWTYVENTPVAWGLVQVGVLGFAILFTFGRRSGPVQSAARNSRLWPLEFVDTLGALYERAGATPAAVDIVYRTFRTAVTRQLRLPLTISDAALAQTVESRLGWYRPGLAQTLGRAADVSRGEKVTPAEALALVQELEYCRQQFGPKKPQEKGRP
jgi:hypothetical protein